MKRKIQIYIEGEKVELFQDENINVSSSVQNISDISKVYTDFSQSFTVPASERNNQIFKHFYNSDYDTTINHNIRRDAVIEIDLTFFRRGKIQLEKAQIKNGSVDNYQITFYGDIRTLKDLFGDIKLSQLNYTDYQFLYTGANVLDKITNPSDIKVRFPLISSKRVWQYNEPTTPLDNIDTSAGAIVYSELFPAIKNKTLFDIIQNDFGVTFSGLFLNDQRFTNSFLWCKNRETFNNVTGTQRLDLQTISVQSLPCFDLVNDTLTVVYEPTATTGIHNISLDVIATSNSTPYTILVYTNGTLTNTINNFGLSNNVISQYDNVVGLNNVLYFEIYAQNTVDIDFQLNYIVDFMLVSTPLQYINIALTGSQVFVNDLNLAANMPDMKVSDYFSSILQEFNLTCYGIDINEWQIDPLEDWYNKGIAYDVTQYTTTDFDIARVPLYKKIKFNYQDSQSFMNDQFYKTFGRRYGNLEYEFPYDGQEYNVSSQFEILMFNKFTGVNLQVGYALTNAPDFKPYVPKPVILYYGGIQSEDYYFNSGSVTLESDYALFGQDLFYNNTQFSLNWGQEISTFTLNTVNNSLFQIYYSNYIINLYNGKNRLTSAKCILPLTILSKLKLNDRLIIRDKRYIINEMKSELTSGEVDFTLLNDFRPIKRRITKPLAVGNGGGTPKFLKAPIIIPNECYEAEIDITGTGILSVSQSILTEDTLIEFEVPPNTSQGDQFITEDGIDFIMLQDGVNNLSTDYSIQVFIVPIEYRFNDGSIEIDQIDFIQEL
jgi:hypothetical protein